MHAAVCRAFGAPLTIEEVALAFASLASCRLASRCESHEMLFVLPLPAECWIR